MLSELCPDVQSVGQSVRQAAGAELNPASPGIKRFKVEILGVEAEGRLDGEEAGASGEIMPPLAWSLGCQTDRQSNR